jgi:hypothetical protein
LFEAAVWDALKIKMKLKGQWVLALANAVTTLSFLK